jgi:cytochrome c-type biogenesis protein CcmF
MTSFGNVLLALGLAGALVSVLALWWGDRLGQKDGERATNVGYLVTFGVAILLTLSLGILLVAFFRNDYAFQYVAENHSTDVSSLAWLYKISALWAGREGSLLLWTWMLALFGSWFAYKRLDVTDRLSNMGLLVVNVVQALFFSAMLFSNPNNPFKASPAEWLGPNGQLLINAAMNPLLQHWAMILHPPTLFIGYAGMVLPFALAVAAIITNDGSRDWVDLIGRETVFAWLFLGMGIGLGAVWAYVVLGWGGYWAWDPVENASLLPWLTGVALLHSFTVYRRRDGFKKWAISLSGVTFALVILGTFITRSGIVQSVHAFEKDPWSLYLFLFMILGSLAVTVGGMLWRGKTFEGHDEFESLTSKEAAYYFNNVLMLVAALLVSYLTISSALPRFLPGGGQNFSAATYDAVARPIGILYVFILAFCPLLSWRKTEGATLWERIRWPLISTAVLSVPLLAEWYLNLRPIYAAQNPTAPAAASLVHNIEGAIGLIVGAFAISTALFLFIDGARKRSAARGEGFGTALWQIMSKARSQTGGYITHLGVGIILIGLVGSAMFVRDMKVEIPTTPGSSAQAGGYALVFRSSNQTTLANGDQKTTVVLDVTRNGKPVGTLEPGQIAYAIQGQTRLNAAVLSEPLRDIFVAFQGEQNNVLVLNVKINPLIWFTWIGFAILLLGTTIALWPRGAKARELATSNARSTSKGAKTKAAVG